MESRRVGKLQSRLKARGRNLPELAADGAVVATHFHCRATDSKRELQEFLNPNPLSPRFGENVRCGVSLTIVPTPASLTRASSSFGERRATANRPTQPFVGTVPTTSVISNLNLRPWPPPTGIARGAPSPTSSAHAEPSPQQLLRCALRPRSRIHLLWGDRHAASAERHGRGDEVTGPTLPWIMAINDSLEA